MSNVDMNNTYQTTALGEAAYLLLKFPLLGTDVPGPGPQVVWHFPSEAREAAKTYYDSDAMVPAKKYALAIRDLKATFSRLTQKGLKSK